MENYLGKVITQFIQHKLNFVILVKFSLNHFLLYVILDVLLNYIQIEIYSNFRDICNTIFQLLIDITLQ